MTFKEMGYVIAVAENKSITEAAKKLFVAQPSITHAIQELEKNLGFKIFERTRTGVEITARGTEFLRDIKSVYEQMRVVEEKYINKLPDRKFFSVSMQHFQFASSAFTDFLNTIDEPVYTAKLLEEKTADIIKNVANGISEIGIISFNETKQKVIQREIKTSGLEFYGIGELQAGIFINKNHPLNSGKAITLSELSKYPIAVYDQGILSSLNFSEEALRTFDESRRIIVNDGLTMINVLSKTNSYTVSIGITTDFLSNNNIVCLPLSGIKRVKLGWIKKSDAILQPLAMEYLKLLNNYIN